MQEDKVMLTNPLPPRGNKHKAGHIDSIILSSRSFEHIFKDESYFIIEIVKGMGIRKLYRWIQDFGKYISRNIVEAKIIHCFNGQKLALIRYSVNKHIQNLIFAGLYSYKDDESSKYLKDILYKLWDELKECYVSRVDIAKDFIGKTPDYIIRSIMKKRSRIYPHKNTNYFKTAKEKKTNTTLNILEYDKAYKDGLKIKLRRVEFVFKKSYFTKIILQQLYKEFPRLEKCFKGFTSNDIKIIGLEP